MGRTSKRHRKTDDEIGLSIIEARYKIPTAAYARLSVEKFEGDTIGTQIDLLKEFISNNDDLSLSDVYVDNGYTGTNFERPEFVRMMEDVQSGRVQCIVVKDLSRFGRNFLETGYYIETLLPKMGARLISINDDFDSSRQSDVESLLLPIRNMVNELYAKDFSKKVSKINESKRRNGTYKIETSAYGFNIDKDNNKFIVNPETAPIVQMIFRLFLRGCTSSEIARQLNLLGVKTPLEYKCDTEFSKPMTGKKLWDTEKVRQILERDEYMGDRCLGRKQIAMYKKVYDWKVPREKWTVYKDDHEALVTREDWTRVHEIMECQISKRREALESAEETNADVRNLFGGRIYCNCCSRLMYFETKRRGDGEISTEAAAYVCKGRTGKENKSGCYNRIELDTLKMVVTEEIRTMIDLIISRDELYKKLVKQNSEDNPIYLYKGRISSIKMKIAETSGSLAKLYEDFSDGILDADDYMKLKTGYQEERKLLELKMEENRKLLKRTEDNIAAVSDLAGKLNDHLKHITLDRDLVELLIDRIEVTDDRRIDIKFKFRDIFEQISGS